MIGFLKRFEQCYNQGMTTQTNEHATLDGLKDRLADVLIVGGGICGLAAGAHLAGRGLSVVVLDKGRSVGGRMATRRLGAGRADHGTQFFTARQEQFEELVAGWRAQNLVFRWSNGWSDGSLAPTTPQDGHARYAVHGGMNSLPKHLAAELGRQGGTIATNIKAIRTLPEEAGWSVQDDSGHTWRSRSLVLTPPAPQSLALMAAGGVALPPQQHAALAAITYAPCLCALCWVEGTVWLPAPGAMQRPGADIAWIADNQRKGISPYAPIYTLHGGPAWSAAHYEDSDETLKETFCAALNEWTNSGKVFVRETQIKRWRYALPVTLHPEPYLRAAGLPPLFFGGDGFGAPRVEGAVLSGLKIAAALAEELKP